MNDNQFEWLITAMAAFLFIMLMGYFFSGCASQDYPSAVCAEYGGVRRVSKNFVFCSNSMVYDKKDRHYIRRGDDNDIPTVPSREPNEVME